MTFINKKPSNTYKDILQIDNSNSGVSSTLKQIKSGSGDGSSIYISEDKLKHQPTTDSTDSVVLYDKDGNALFTIDTTNDLVKLGISQIHANTQYATFGVSSADTVWAGKTENTHTAVPFNSNGLSGVVVNLGTSTNPATTLTVGTIADDLVNSFMAVPTNIVVDSVSFWVGANGATGDTLRCHLMSFDIVTTAGATGGDLSNGVVIADGADIVSAGYEQSYYQSMTVQSSSVSAGKVLLFLFRQDGTNSDYSVSANLKYHLVYI